MLAVFLLTTSSSAFGQQNGENTRDEARDAYETGRRAYNIGQWHTAIAGFAKAYNLTGDPLLLFNIAQAHRQAGNPNEALTAYRSFLREMPDHPNAAIARVKIDELLAPSGGTSSYPTTETEPPKAETDLATPAVPRMPPPTTEPPRAETVLTESGHTQPATFATDFKRWLPWVGTGITIAFASAAIATGLSAQNRFGELQDSCGQTKMGCTDAEIQNVSSKVTTANVLWGLAAVSAVGTGIAFYLSVGPEQSHLSLAWRY